ncbi:MAG TPA: alpha/beta hydrolase [Gaiellales bacterium]
MALHHEVAGEGPAVVFVHAGICDSGMWDHQWQSLASGRRLLRYDMRGYGRSPLPPEPYSSARDLLDVMDAAGIERAALVAVSLGGRVALEVALVEPTRVSGLVVVGSGLPGHDWSPEAREFFTAEDLALERGDLDAAAELNVCFWVVGPRRSPDQVDASVRDRVHEMQKHAFELQLPTWEQAEERPVAPDLADRLAEIEQPTLVLVGAEDQPDIHAIADQLVRTLPNVGFESIPDAGHVPNMEQPAQFDRLVGAFLDG